MALIYGSAITNMLLGRAGHGSDLWLDRWCAIFFGLSFGSDGGQLGNGWAITNMLLGWAMAGPVVWFGTLINWLLTVG